MKKLLLISITLGICTLFASAERFSSIDFGNNELSNQEDYRIYHAYCCTHCVVMVGRTTRKDAEADKESHKRAYHGGRSIGYVSITSRLNTEPEPRPSTKCLSC